MIRNFEEYTHEMTPDEQNHIVPFLVHMLTLAINKEKAITNKKMVNAFNTHYKRLYYQGQGEKLLKTSGPRIRKLIHIIRVSDTIPMLVASSKGYYISDDKDEIETYIGSIEDRIRSIYQIRRALKRQLNKSRESQEAIQTKLILE